MVKSEIEVNNPTNKQENTYPKLMICTNSYGVNGSEARQVIVLMNAYGEGTVLHSFVDRSLSSIATTVGDHFDDFDMNSYIDFKGSVKLTDNFYKEED